MPSAPEPIDPRVRLAIAQWPDDAPRGAVSTFCAEHGISRKSFYELRKRASAEGQAAVLEPRSRRPKTSPTRLTDDVKDQAVAVRAALESSGLDHGPISVHDKMKSMGLHVVPSVTSLARIFREAGVARLEPRKRPRAAWRRFVYPAPNACWQMDATEYVLTGGRKCVVFQLTDDHSRAEMASLAAWGETSEAAITTFDKAVAVYGVPQRLLTDNGSALNPTRRGYSGQLVEHVERLGVKAITGKPNKPTTQGKNERFHQTLFRWLDKQPLAATLAELQAQLDEFNVIFNTQRPHQGLPGRVTPMTAYLATAKADEPRPDPNRRRKVMTHVGDEIITVKRLQANGSLSLERVQYMVSSRLARQEVRVTLQGDRVIVADLDGVVIIEHTRPPFGVRYVSNGRGKPQRKNLEPPRRPRPSALDADTQIRRLDSNGQLNLNYVIYVVDRCYARWEVLVVTTADRIIITDFAGEILADHARPAPGVKYVSNGGTCTHRAAPGKPSPKS